MKWLVAAVLGIWALTSHAADAPAEEAAPEVAAEQADGPYPLEYWAVPAAIDNVQVSPDGKRLGLLRVSSRDGDPVLEIYETADLTKKPFRMDADPMKIAGFSWASDKHVLFGATQQVRKIIDDFNQGAFGGKLGLLNFEKKEVEDFGIDGDTVSVLWRFHSILLNSVFVILF